MVTWENPCSGFNKEPTRTYRTSLDIGSRFGGRLIGCCPDEGCAASVGKNGRLKKHETRSGEFARRLKAKQESDAASRARGIDPNDPRHLS
jgi:hypothetical protein